MQFRYRLARHFVFRRLIDRLIQWIPRFREPRGYSARRFWYGRLVRPIRKNVGHVFSLIKAICVYLRFRSRYGHIFVYQRVLPLIQNPRIESNNRIWFTYIFSDYHKSSADGPSVGRRQQCGECIYLLYLHDYLFNFLWYIYLIVRAVQRHDKHSEIK